MRATSTATDVEMVVELRGQTTELLFKMGGRRGNIVTHSSTPKVQKGWRLLAINERRITRTPDEDATGGASDASVAAEVQELLAAAQQKSRYAATFVDPLMVPAKPRSVKAPAPVALPAPSAPVAEVVPEPTRVPVEEAPQPPAPAPEPVADVVLPPPGTPPREKIRTTGALKKLPPKGDVEDPQHSLLFALIGAEAPIKKTGPCDKCDGPHHADDCPFFKKSREEHADAVEAYGKKEDVQGDAALVILLGARVVPQPGDGSCLFHSLSHGLAKGEGAAELRAAVAAYVQANPDVAIQGTPLRDWVLWDSGLNVEDYAARMGTGHHWGGAIEIAVCSLLKGVNVHIYERVDDAFKRISAFDAVGAEKTIHVVYGGRVHYDALRVPSG